MSFIQRLRLSGLLSFPPDMEFFELHPLNVLIGPNVSGKSNFIEALELLRALPVDFSAAIRDGGGAEEWLWKGCKPSAPATIEVETDPGLNTGPPLRYRLSFTAVGQRVQILDEAIEEAYFQQGFKPYFYYTFQQGRPVINVRTPGGQVSERQVQWDNPSLDQPFSHKERTPIIIRNFIGLVCDSSRSRRSGNGRLAATACFDGRNEPIFRKTGCFPTPAISYGAQPT